MRPNPDALPVLILLAAGAGRRFGGREHKLAQTLGDGTVLGRSLTQALASGLPIVVITTARLAALAGETVASRDIVLLPEVGSEGADLGMGRSIAAGVAARPHAPGWLVMPADMPLVQPASLRAVADALTHHPVAYAQHRGRRGHPVGFGAELFSELVRLQGDEGARRLVARYPAQAVELADAGVLMDVDTPEDLARVRANDAARMAAVR